MPTNEEIAERIRTALLEKTGHARPCSVCGKNVWHLIPTFVHLSVTSKLGNVVVGGSGFPMQPLICSNCGNTHLLNLQVLGIKDLDSLQYTDDDGK